MSTGRNRLYPLLAIILSAGATLPANAATLNQWFSNDTTSNAIYLWLTASSAPTTDITNVIFDAASAMSAWGSTGTTDSLVLYGPAANAGAGRVQLRFDYSVRPFSFEYAEVLWNGGEMTLLDSGTLSRGTGSWTSSAAFTRVGDISSPFAAPVPVPSSLILLLSTVLCTVLYRHGAQVMTRFAV